MVLPAGTLHRTVGLLGGCSTALQAEWTRCGLSSLLAAKGVCEGRNRLQRA